MENFEWSVSEVSEWSVSEVSGVCDVVVEVVCHALRSHQKCVQTRPSIKLDVA